MKVVFNYTHPLITLWAGFSYYGSGIIQSFLIICQPEFQKDAFYVLYKLSNLNQYLDQFMDWCGGKKANPEDKLMLQAQEKFLDEMVLIKGQWMSRKQLMELYFMEELHEYIKFL